MEDACVWCADGFEMLHECEVFFGEFFLIVFAGCDFLSV